MDDPETCADTDHAGAVEQLLNLINVHPPRRTLSPCGPTSAADHAWGRLLPFEPCISGRRISRIHRIAPCRLRAYNVSTRR